MWYFINFILVSRFTAKKLLVWLFQVTLTSEHLVQKCRQETAGQCQKMFPIMPKISSFFLYVFHGPARHDYFTHFEPSQSLGWAKTGGPREKTRPPASRTWLVSHVTRSGHG